MLAPFILSGTSFAESRQQAPNSRQHISLLEHCIISLTHACSVSVDQVLSFFDQETCFTTDPANPANPTNPTNPANPADPALTLWANCFLAMLFLALTRGVLANYLFSSDVVSFLGADAAGAVGTCVRVRVRGRGRGFFDHRG